MPKFHELKQELEDCRCDECQGTGMQDDADIGDITYNEWECPACKGTGLKFKVHLDIDYSVGGILQMSIKPFVERLKPLISYYDVVMAVRLKFKLSTHQAIEEVDKYY